MIATKRPAIKPLPITGSKTSGIFSKTHFGAKVIEKHTKMDIKIVKKEPNPSIFKDFNAKMH